MLRAGLLLVTLSLTGCPRPPPAEVPSRPPPVDAATQPAPGAVAYTIDAGASRLAIEVLRSGPLAKFGHNHVVTSRDLTGHLYVHARTELTRFVIFVPVAGFIVDDEAARHQAGPDFPPGVPAEDKAATRANMLGTAVLDAASHPHVEVRSVAIKGASPALEVLAAITLRDVTRRIQMPVTVTRTAEQIRARGAFELRQSDFGITPFSVALGAVSVADAVRVRFEIVAHRESA